MRKLGVFAVVIITLACGRGPRAPEPSPLQREFTDCLERDASAAGEGQVHPGARVIDVVPTSAPCSSRSSTTPGSTSSEVTPGRSARSI